MIDYHNRIMNLQPRNDIRAPTPAMMYKLGHKDARHAAAEIAIEAEREIKRLHELLEKSHSVPKTDS